MKIEFTNKIEFSKKNVIVDRFILAVLLFLTIRFPEIDLITLDAAWIAKMGVTDAFYSWKAKTENRTKVPLNVIKGLPEDMRDKIDLTQIITAIIQHD